MKQLKLLCVDDDEGIIKALQRVLKSPDYDVVCADSGSQALEILENEEVHVVLSDLMMPDINGIELLTTVKEKHPDIVRLILTGADDKNLIAKLINTGGIYRYITKPWDNEELKSIINQGFHFYKINSDNKRLVKENKKISEDLVEMNLRLNSDKESQEKLLNIYINLLDEVKTPVIYIDSFRKIIRCNQSSRELLRIMPEDTLDVLFSRLDDDARQTLQQYIEVEYRPEISEVQVNGSKFKVKSLGSPNNYIGLVMIGE